MKLAISIFLSILCYSLCQAQEGFRYSIDANFELGYTNDGSPGKIYRSSNFNAPLVVQNRFPLFARNSSFGITVNFKKYEGFRASFGFINYGFHIKGNESSSGGRFNTIYKIGLYEWGISYVRRIPVKASEKIVLESGMRLHSFRSQEFGLINVWRQDGFSFSFYAGYEVPMFRNFTFANLGIQLRLPVTSYSRQISGIANIEGMSNYYPYFIGLRSSISFQFDPYLE